MKGVLVVTLKVAEAESPVVPVTVIVYVPGTAPVLTTKPAPSTWPDGVIVHVAVNRGTTLGVAGACENLHVPASPTLNPPPLTVMAVPIGAALGDNVMKGPRTVRVAEAASPVLPVTVTVYVPGETAPIVKLPLGAPLPGVTKEQVTGTTAGPPLIVHDVSAAENPTPSTTMVAPSGPELGIRVIVG
jgi:hypothetical protein